MLASGICLGIGHPPHDWERRLREPLRFVSEEEAQRRTQEVFRRANERLLTAVEGRVRSDRAIPFLCGCPDPDCRSMVPLTVDDYSALREHPRRFAIVPAHPTHGG